MTESELKLKQLQAAAVQALRSGRMDRLKKVRLAMMKLLRKAKS